MLNLVELQGRLTANPELKTTPSGVKVTSFSLAVERNYQSGEERQTDFINIVAWRGTAEFICRYFPKGKMMLVVGSLQVRNYTANDGTKRYVTEVVANEVYFAGDKTETLQKPDVEYSDSNTDDGYTEISSEDDLPF